MTNIISLIEAERAKMAKEMVYAKEYLRGVKLALTPEQIGKLEGEIDTRHEALSSIDRILAAFRNVALTQKDLQMIESIVVFAGSSAKADFLEDNSDIWDKLTQLSIGNGKG